jgi:hypothetical protein
MPNATDHTTTPEASTVAALDDTLLTFARQCDDEADEWAAGPYQAGLSVQRRDELAQLANMARLMHQLYVEQGAPDMDAQHVHDGLAAGARFLETLEAQRYAMAPPARHGVGG